MVSDMCYNHMINLSTSFASLNNDFNNLKKNLIDLNSKITTNELKAQFSARFTVFMKIFF